MKVHERAPFLAALSLLCALAASCSASNSPGFVNLHFDDVTCDLGACEWIPVEGAAAFHGTWNAGDIGADLSGAGRIVIEQRSSSFRTPIVRDYALTATVLRDPGVTLVFELHWYRSGDGGAPVLLKTITYPVQAEGLTRFRTPSSIPADATGVTLRVVRDGGDGRCWVDELDYKTSSGSSAAD